MNLTLRRIFLVGRSVFGVSRYAIVLLFFSIRRYFIKPEKNSFLILPGDVYWFPHAKGSLGDDILALSVCQSLTEKHPDSKLGFIRVVDAGDEQRASKFYGYDIKEELFFSTLKSLTRQLQFLVTCNYYANFVIIGADVLDGGYSIEDTVLRLKLLRIANFLGCKTSILGCSFRETKSQSIINAFKAIEKKTIINVRDEVSLVRLSRVVNAEINQVADIGFLVNAENYPSHYQEIEFLNRIMAFKNSGKEILAINLCGWMVKDVDGFIDTFISVLEQVMSVHPNVMFLLIPHDYREGDVTSDVFVLKKLYARLSELYPDKVYLADFIVSSVTAKKIVAVADILVTGRMHLAIAAMSQNVPTISFVYQHKFEGLYKLYHLGTEYMFDINNCLGLKDQILKILSQRDILSKHIKNENIEIFRLARKNFETI